MEKLIDVKGANDLLGVYRHTLEKWKKKGTVPFIRLGRRCLFSVSALDSWVEQHRVEVRE